MPFRDAANRELCQQLVQAYTVERSVEYEQAGHDLSMGGWNTWGMGIASCPATIYEPEAARTLLNFPDEVHLHVALSFGYPRNPDDLNAPPKRGGRRSFDESVHFETWTNETSNSSAHD